MHKIYKYDINSHTKIDLPKGAEVRSVGVQHGKPFIWVEIDGTQPTETRHFITFATGQEFDPSGLTYIGSFHGIDGWMVFHLFEMKGE